MTHSNQGDIIIISSLIILALLIILIAWAVKFKKQVGFIAGYDENTCRDKDGLANYIGTALLVTGIVCLALAATMFIIPVYTKPLMGIYFISLALGTVIAAVGGNKFIKGS